MMGDPWGPESLGSFEDCLLLSNLIPHFEGHLCAFSGDNCQVRAGDAMQIWQQDRATRAEQQQKERQ